MSVIGTTKQSPERVLQKENETLKRIIGEQTIVIDAFKKTLEGRIR